MGSAGSRYHWEVIAVSLVDMCAVGAKVMVGKTAGAWAGSKAVAPNCAKSHCILHHRTLAVKKMRD